MLIFKRLGYLAAKEDTIPRFLNIEIYYYIHFQIPKEADSSLKLHSDTRNVILKKKNSRFVVLKFHQSDIFASLSVSVLLRYTIEQRLSRTIRAWLPK